MVCFAKKKKNPAFWKLGTSYKIFRMRKLCIFHVFFIVSAIEATSHFTSKLDVVIFFYDLLWSSNQSRYNDYKVIILTWLVVWLPFVIFPYIGNVIIPIDSYFSEGWPNHQPVTIVCFYRRGRLTDAKRRGWGNDPELFRNPPVPRTSDYNLYGPLDVAWFLTMKTIDHCKYHKP